MTGAEIARGALARTLESIFLEVAAACDGQRLVASALAQPTPTLSGRSLHVLALGKAAGPMLAGLSQVVPPAQLASGLVIEPAARPLAGNAPGPQWALLPGEHPIPGAGSLRAGAAARDFVAKLPAREPLLVLLSGGGSALACLPADGLSFADKRAALATVARAGAPIGALNIVRKHLSAIKGGRLGLLARGPVLVLALSDVVGDDPGTIASGPFSPDPSTYAEAQALLARYANLADSAAVAAAAAHLAAGAAGRCDETAKPGPRLAHVEYRVIAGPAHVTDQASRAAAARGLTPSILVRNTQADVSALARTYVEQARQVLGSHAHGVIAIGNGEPTIDLSSLPAQTAAGTGGRATHLALLVARGLAEIAAGAGDAPGQPRTQLAFLAAGTDDRDGSSDASGAVVTAETWQRALAAGLDPEAALARFDSATVLGALGALVRGPGTSNLLDLHLLAAAGTVEAIVESTGG